MHNVFDCVKAFSLLLNTEYDIVLGRKGVTANLHLVFDKKDCYHLMGLQYLRDLPYLAMDRGKVFDAIANGTLTVADIEKSDLYHRIERRVDLLPYLENIIDSNDTIFKYNRKVRKFSMIDADYLLKNTLLTGNVFVFLSQNIRSSHYYCRSFFPEENIDYAEGQAVWTLLYKAKTNVQTGEKQVLFDKFTKKNAN